MSERARTLILGVGNPLRGDDGIGPAVIAALRERPLPPHVSLQDAGTPGLEIALLFEGYERAIVVDAADFRPSAAAVPALAPGSWRRLRLSDVVGEKTSEQAPGNLHAAGLAEALALADALGLLPADMVIYAVQLASAGRQVGLSEAVERAVASLAAAIAAEV